MLSSDNVLASAVCISRRGAEAIAAAVVSFSSGRDSLDVVVLVWLIGLPVPPQVHCHDAMAVRERRYLVAPVRVIAAPAMDEQQRRIAATHGQIRELHPVSSLRFHRRIS